MSAPGSLTREQILAHVAAGSVGIEHHTSGDEDGETVGWRAYATPELSVWVGDLSRAAFERMDVLEQRMMTSDMGAFIVIYDESRPRDQQEVVIGKLANPYNGQFVATALAYGLRAGVRPEEFSP